MRHTIPWTPGSDAENAQSGRVCAASVRIQVSHTHSGRNHAESPRGLGLAGAVSLMLHKRT